MNAGRTARDRARAELTDEIKRAARRQLREHGAAGLSLRAVARELGMVSSALYRYFPSRDDLLTALIIDAYNGLADRLEAADRSVPAGRYRERWRATCAALRGWATAGPHEYALVYGSPVPGYHAPEATIAHASRVPVALLATVADAHRAGVLAPMDGPPLSPSLAEQASRTADLSVPGLPAPVVVRFALAWTQLFGMVGMELFGHLDNTFDPAGPLADHAYTWMADLLGLPAD